MEIHTINHTQYYSAKDLKATKNICFKGCTSNASFIGTRVLLKGVDYEYFKIENGNHVISDKGILMVTKKWVDEYHAIHAPPPIEPDIIASPYAGIETRGCRKTCYFLLTDVTTALGARGDLLKGLEYKQHYTKFACSQTGENKLFLTHEGLVKATFSIKTAKARELQDCLINTMINKSKPLVKSGLEKSMVDNFFAASCVCVSGIYLIRIGLVRDLRKALKIPAEFADTKYVYKYGQSKDICVRFNQHARTYSKLGIGSILLVKYCQLDPIVLNKAEADVKNLFVELGLKLDNIKHTELAIFGPNDTVLAQFTKLLQGYAKTNKDLVQSLDKTQSEIEYLKSMLIAKQREIDLLQSMVKATGCV